MSVTPPAAGAERERDALFGFRIGRTRLALPAHQVDQVIAWEPATPIPRAPAHVLGLISWRSRPVPVLELGTFLELPTGSRDESDRLVVASAGGMRVAVVTDMLEGLLEGPAERPVDLARDPRTEPFVKEELDATGGIVMVLDLGALLEAARPKGC